MLDSLVRVSRRVLRVPKAVASQTGIIVYCPSKDSACQQLASHGYGTRPAPNGSRRSTREEVHDDDAKQGMERLRVPRPKSETTHDPPS
ncbi:hypothetical protein M0804_015252 [Polistes exclamans]|nr:hypothetical protein M0804_015474 [Polistes exclamans]KAI4473441.1 hypothetical protein M0804_015349 [Polistes exclamans]KAI4473648.1 hypothetical protein M0804_015252 [Polistes exclamans]